MSKIGYAVFGSPRGIAVQSNGLFKELNLDKSLYLNSSHVVLERGQQALMLRRVPSNMNSLDKKDALLLVLYEHALPNGENRPGGFLGSAICFAENSPNADKMITGLFYLFSQMKRNVDDKSRFREVDSSNWNVKLPDSNKEFGMFENTILTYSPLSRTGKNVVIKLNNLEKESVSLLSNFLLNRSFHEIDFLYASDSNEVINRMTNNGFESVEYGALFDYSKLLSVYSNRINEDNEKLRTIKNQGKELQNQIETGKNELNRLINDGNTKRNEIEKSNADIVRISQELNGVKQKIDEERRNLDQVRRLGNKTSSRENSHSTPKDTLEIQRLNQLFNTFSTIIREQTNLDVDQAFNDRKEERNLLIVEDFFYKLPERKAKARKRLSVIFGILLISTLTFLGLFVYKGIEIRRLTEKLNETTVEMKKNKDAIKKDKVDVEESKKHLENLNKYKIGGKTPDYKKFNQHAELILNNFLNNEYKNGSPELNFIKYYQWQFWEFDYRNDELVKKLKLSDDKYFVNLDNEIKPINKNKIWQGDSGINKHLESYLDEHNDIYQNIPEEILKALKDNGELEKHFKWVVEKSNGIKSVKEKDKVGFPYFKN